MNTDQLVARALINIGAVGFAPNAPITFKSGIKSPVYVDNRKFPFHPAEWSVVIEGFKNLLTENNIPCDVIAGVEAAGIPHSAALGFSMQKPSVFVRKQVKDHGTKSRIEGGNIQGLSVVLVEDLVSTGGSSLDCIEALRSEGANASDCIVIVTYDFPESTKAFAEANVNLHALTTFPVILTEAIAAGKLTEQDAEIVRDWFADPHGWAAKHNF
jgi:orotate phosphoribosyltransferase